MNEMLLPLGLLALLALMVHVVRLVARDGHGTCVVPRSHAAELGSWADRELRR